LDAGHDVALVLTQPDRPAGRGLRPAPSAVKRLATQRGLTLFQPQSLKTPEDAQRVTQARADALVVAAYGLILPPNVLKAAPHGALNIHASLLPRWRGAAPIQRALLAGDRETGVSIMQMDAGLDTGPVLSRHPLPIAADDDAGTLHDKLAAIGAEAMVSALADVEAGRARAVRAFRPAPGAFALLDGEPVKIWRARVVDQSGEPGTVQDSSEELVIACGEKALAVCELQRAGGRRLSAREFLHGHRLPAGTRFA